MTRAHQAPTSPGRLHRWLVRGLFVLGLLAALWFFVVPEVLANRLAAALEDAGLANAHVQVERLSWRELVLAPIRCGDDATLHIARLHVTFTPAELLDRRVEIVALDGVEWRLAARGATGLSLAPFDRLTANDSKPPSGTLLAELPAIRLPMQRLTLRDLRIVPPKGSRIPELTGSAVLEQNATRLTASLTMAMGAQELSVAGSLRSGSAIGEVRVHVGDCEQPLALTGTLGIRSVQDGRVAELKLASNPDFRLGWRRRSLVATGTRILWSAAVTEAAGSTRTMQSALRIETAPGGKLALAGAWPESLAGFELHGFELGIDWPDLTEPRSAPRQRLRWQQIKLGDMGIRAGNCVFAIEGHELVVANLRWTMEDGGEIQTGAFRVGPDTSKLSLGLTVRNLSLQSWCDMLGKDKVAATGRVSGRLRASVAWRPRLRVRLLAGHIATTRPGILRVSDDEDTTKLLEAHVDQIARRVSPEHHELIKRRIFGALRDFAFERLAFDVLPHAEDLTLAVHLKGKGRRVPQELDLNVNLNGINSLLNLALDLKQGVDDTRSGIERKLDKKD